MAQQTSIMRTTGAGSTRRVLGALALVSITLLGSLPAHATDTRGRGRMQPVVQTMDGRDKHHGGRDHHDHQWGGRGHAKAERPDRPHHPPRPVVVVPPCKRGGPGITPC
jgi:hypothetical protein